MQQRHDAPGSPSIEHAAASKGGKCPDMMIVLLDKLTRSFRLRDHVPIYKVAIDPASRLPMLYFTGPSLNRHPSKGSLKWHSKLNPGGVQISNLYAKDLSQLSYSFSILISLI
jgi:hypothetical protein